jgi:non-ribosomal peptide synthetase component F
MRFPVSSAQQRLWLHDQVKPGTPTFNMPYAIWLDGALDAQALQRAMDALVTRQAVLRTSITVFDGVPEQVVADIGTTPIERIELAAGLDDGERTRQAESIAVGYSRRPFDLAGPLLRAALIGAGASRHLFVLVMHHIISDGVSMNILFKELSALYRAEITGVPASLPELWMEYGDYAVWQHDLMRGEELDRQLGYWREQLRNVPAMLALPTDRPRPARQSSSGAAAMVTMDAETTGRLATVANGANVTMFMLFLTGFVAVLSRYARQTDMVIGTQAAGRTHTELEPIIGLFTNTIPLRFSLADNPTFSELLGQVRDTTLDGLAHQQLPFDRLVETLVPDRVLAHAPLIQAQFVYGSLTAPALDFPGISSHTKVLSTDTAKLDLTLYADGSPGQSSALVLEYNTDIFGPAWADRFLSCMVHLLGHAADAPDTPVTALPLLSATERDALTIGRNHQQPADDDSTDFRHLLQVSTSRVIAGDEVVPMSQVCDRAARIARALADRGVGVETPVGLCAERGIGMLTALLGVWWAGAACVPLDPCFPAARLATMTRGAGLETIVADAAHSDLVRSVADGATVIRVDDPATTAATPLAPVPVPASALACVIFTPGSAWLGVDHRAVTSLLVSSRRTLKIGTGDRAAAAAPPLDTFLFELVLSLTGNADLVIASAGEAREPDRLRSLIERTGATVMRATPPADHSRVYILDELLMPVPVGAVGEICLAGRGVGRGYYQRPRLTAQSFRPDPWGDEPGARMYRTGDLGRWRDDGSFELIGRNDHQVTIRGFRIECGEIEATLRKHRDVRQAVVVTAPRAGQLELVAYIMPRRGSAIAQPGADPLDELRPHLRATLPDYMIPALIVALPALPLTPTAKVDRAALPAPQWDLPSGSAEDDLPRNPVEAALAAIWSDLLGTQAPVGVHDNLFGLGGHSLTATRFVARVADTYGVSLPVYHVFAGPTVAQLAEVIAADPDFKNPQDSPRHAELDDLSDDDLDDLLRAALAQRDKRRAGGT